MISPTSDSMASTLRSSLSSYRESSSPSDSMASTLRSSLSSYRESSSPSDSMASTLRSSLSSYRESSSPSDSMASTLRSSLSSYRESPSSPPDSMASTRRSSLSSNPESPSSPARNGTQTMIPGQDADFHQTTFTNELLDCGLKEERFRIDRKKLEDMLQVQKNSNETVENAEVFFQRVMMETSTLISWPSKLKIGAKSKKDPHVKIVGKPEAVQQAKESILEILDTKKNRVTLKMDVSHSDHSYIIGKGGFKIQQVMEETGCHIHFPDSNRNSSTEKSNQVSIAGQASGVELARAKIRDLLPLVFTFELPNGKTVSPGKECSPDIQHIQQTYSFNVSFRSIGMNRTLLEVRGCQRLLSRLRQGLSLLMEYLTGSKTVPIMGFMKTEIAAQHHQFVMGACNVNTQMIMNKTGATIIFPDSYTYGPESPSHHGTLISGLSKSTYGSESPSHCGPLINGLSKSTVIIQGSFDSVCMAWQELLKCLPLVLMFDLKEGQELDPVMVNNFMEAFNINIMVRPKIKENTKSVLIRGAEKDCKVLFQVRKDILGLDEEDGDISPKLGSFRGQFAGRFPQMETRDKLERPAQPSMSTAESLSLLSNIIQQNPQIVGLLSNLSTAFPAVNPPDVLPHPTLPNPVYRNAPNPVQQIPMSHYTVKRDIENWINRHDRGYAAQTGGNFQGHFQRYGNLPADDRDSGIFLRSRTRFQGGLESRSDVSSRPESSASSTSSNDTPDYKANAFLRKISQSNEPNMGSDIHHLLVDYGNKKINANKAMKQPIGEAARTPTQLWSGYGFSKSVPDFAARAKRTAQSSGSISEFLDMDSSKIGAAASKAWTPDIVENNSPVEQVASPFGFSNYWDNIPQQPAINYGSIKSLDQLLTLLDLQKYSEILSHHEIDLATFLTLSDMDLRQLDISYGARRKILAAIAAIRDHRLGDWSLKNFKAAPGAERRSFMARYPSDSPFSEDERV